MHPHHSEDYKLTAVKYYLSKNEDMRDVCKIFKCSYKSLSRWVNQYQEKGNVKRKTRKNSNIKIKPEIEKFVKHKITRKRLRNKYYPENREGQKKQDLEEFYKTLNKYDYKNYLLR